MRRGTRMGRLAREKEGDGEDVLSLYGRVFGEAFPDDKRAANRLRIGRLPEKELSFVVRDGMGVLVGSVRCTKVSWRSGGSEKWEEGVMLGPLAVLPELRGQGVGKGLVERVLAEVAERSVVITFGDPGYFVPFGFCVLSHKDLDISGDVRPLSAMVYGEEKKDEISVIVRGGSV